MGHNSTDGCFHGSIFGLFVDYFTDLQLLVAARQFQRGLEKPWPVDRLFLTNCKMDFQFSRLDRVFLLAREWGMGNGE